MGPENSLVLLYSFGLLAAVAYTLYHLLTTRDIGKMLIGAAFAVGAGVLLVRQIKNNITGV